MSVLALAPLPVLILVAAAAIVATGCTTTIDFDGDTTRRVEREVVPLAGIESIDVSTGNGRDDVVGADVDEIEVDVIMRESDEGDADYRIDVDRGVLAVDGECDSGWFEQCSVGFVVTVPHDLDVEVDTDNGQIVLERLGGDIRVETDNGAINGDELTADDVQAQTDNGRIRLIFDAAPGFVEATTDNGAIDVLVPDDGTAYDVDADSDNGSVDVDVERADGSDHRIIARSDNGSVDVDVRR